MLKRMLKLDVLPKYFDATDALGVAVCHQIQMASPFAKLNSSSLGNKKKKLESFF